jgi:hypothetical protein
LSGPMRHRHSREGACRMSGGRGRVDADLSLGGPDSQ